MLEFGREITSDAEQSTRREWLVTNGIGGYASGTLNGVLTRRYHGLLVAALKPPLGRMVLLTKFDEIAVYAGKSYEIHTNHWRDEHEHYIPEGYRFIEHFRLEGTIPVWTFALADAHLQKQVWMQHGENTTYVRYTHKRGNQPIELYIKALVNYKDFHATTSAQGWRMQIDPIENGLRILPFSDATPFFLLSDRAEAEMQHEWYQDYYLSQEAYRGQDDLSDHLNAAMFTVTLQPGQSVTLVASVDLTPNLDGEKAFQDRLIYEQNLLSKSHLQDEPRWVQQLVLAADQFIVKRPIGHNPDGRSIIAGYPWFSDWGRDTMIALPGLTLATRRFDEAQLILRTFAEYVDQGMLPNHFPASGDEPEYNTVDASLWYFEAIQQVYNATQDLRLLKDLYPVLQEIIVWHRRGTRYQIHVDPQDGLLYSGESGVQLTWMDVKIDHWVVTPRTGKAIDVNALWYNALRIMAGFARLLGHDDASTYDRMADQAAASFGRFWYHGGGYCYDVIDGVTGDDPSLRPNQLFAVALPHSPLTPKQKKTVVDICARRLVTSMGLRSLDPAHPEYRGHYGGNRFTRDSAYHQGTVWAWLIGSFVAAHWRIYQDQLTARSFLQPFADHLLDAGMGTISECADGDAPHRPRAAIAQAWSVAEVLRVWLLTAPQ